MKPFPYPESREPRPGGLRLWVPRLILAAAAVHMTVGLTVSSSHWSGIVTDGLWNTVRVDDDARMTALWFMMSGVAFAGLGLLARRSVITTGAVPPDTGWILLALGIPMALLEPVSGGWSLIVIGVLAVLASRRDSLGRGTGAATARRPGGAVATGPAARDTAAPE